MDKTDALKELLKAVDTACWCWAVQSNSKRKGQVDWKSSFNELCDAYEKYQLKTSDCVAVIPSDKDIIGGGE